MKRHLRRLLEAKSGVFAVIQTGLVNVAVQASNICCGIVTARTLGPSGRGSLAAMIMWPQILAYCLAFGIPTSSLFFMKRRPESASDFVGAALMLSLSAGALATLVGVLVIPHFLHTYSPATIRFSQIAMVLAPLSLLSVTLTSHVQAADQFKIYNTYRFVAPVSILVVLLVERFTHTLTAETAALAYLVAGLPALVWITLWVLRHFRPKFQNLRSSAKTILGYGMRAWGSDLLGTVANQVDRVLVVGMLSPDAMGLYVVAQSAANVLAVLPGAVAPVTLPKSAGMSHEQIIELSGRAIRMTLLVMVLASLPLLVAGQFLLKLVYGPKFMSASLVLPFLVIETILDGLTYVLSQTFLASGLPGTVTLLEGSGLVASIPLLFWLIPHFGLRGAGCALMLGTLTRFLCVLISFPLRLKVRPPNMIIGRSDLRALLRKQQPAKIEASL